MLSGKEMERKYLEDNEVMKSLTKALDEMKVWIADTCTQEWPYEGCPRGPVWHFSPFADQLPEVREFADKLYDKYLSEIDSRRSM